VDQLVVDEYLTWCTRHPYGLKNPLWKLECGASTGADLHSNAELHMAFESLKKYGFDQEALLKFITHSRIRALHWGDLATQSRLCTELDVDDATCDAGKPNHENPQRAGLRAKG